jgi:hypothetical protein
MGLPVGAEQPPVSTALDKEHATACLDAGPGLSRIEPRPPESLEPERASCGGSGPTTRLVHAQPSDWPAFSPSHAPTRQPAGSIAKRRAGIVRPERGHDAAPPCPTVPLSHRLTVPRFLRPTVPLSHGSSVPLFHCPTRLLGRPQAASANAERGVVRRSGATTRHPQAQPSHCPTVTVPGSCRPAVLRSHPSARPASPKPSGHRAAGAGPPPRPTVPPSHRSTGSKIPLFSVSPARRPALRRPNRRCLTIPRRRSILPPSESAGEPHF